MNDFKLNIDEVMCLQRIGMTTSSIRKADYATFRELCDRYPQIDDDIDEVNMILDRQEEAGIISYTCLDDPFPRRLLSIGDDCPAVIHCLGNLDLLKARKSVAVIGARACSKAGSAKAFELGQRFAKEGYVVVSGLALGCDTSAHKGCLSVNGPTIAIVANGLDTVYPTQNARLQEEILRKGGLIISEQTVGILANGKRLVARNRLQAAMSDKVILAECPEKSGSMHTMRFARQYGRECLAVRYPAWNEFNGGNRELISRRLASPLN